MLNKHKQILGTEQLTEGVYLLLVRRSLQFKLQNTKLAILTKEISELQKKTIQTSDWKEDLHILGASSGLLFNIETIFRNKKKRTNKQTINITSHNTQAAKAHGIEITWPTQVGYEEARDN